MPGSSELGKGWVMMSVRIVNDEDPANQPVLYKIQRSKENYSHIIITITIPTIHIPIPCIYQPRENTFPLVRTYSLAPVESEMLHMPHVLLPKLEDSDSDERLEGAPGTIWFLFAAPKSLDF